MFYHSDGPKSSNWSLLFAQIRNRIFLLKIRPPVQMQAGKEGKKGRTLKIRFS